MKGGHFKSNDSRAFTPEQFRGRLWFVLGFLSIAAGGLIARAVDLQLLDKGFLEGQGDARFTRPAKLSAHRGSIFDRNGDPLAVSTPVDSIWVNPSALKQAANQIPRLAEALNRDPQWITARISSNLERSFLYLVRHMRPQDAAQVKALGIPGVYLQREYRRYYPAGEVTGHLLGFSSIDDVGQEGLELAYDHSLGGEAGEKRVIQDRLGRIVEDVESIRAPRPGQDLTTSIDMRIQYLAYRELKAAVQRHNANAGSIVVIDVDTGEVLAMASQPAFNPNDREQVVASRYKNRAATDIFEPGSSMKPFVAAAGVATGRYHGGTIIDTNPGFLRVGNWVTHDEHPLGAAPLTAIIAKSSNVGMAKVALSLEPAQMWRTLDAFGFGKASGSGFPGESAGMLTPYSQWSPSWQASISRGYALQVTALQLAHAYATLGAGGISRPISLRKIEGPVQGERVLDESVAREMLQIMEGVVSEEGTGKRAALYGYRVAGKTGTAMKAENGGYSTEKFTATFGGIVPASRPKLAAIVAIDEPKGTEHYGGDVAAPVFANVMAGALRLIGVPPDGLDTIVTPALLQADMKQ